MNSFALFTDVSVNPQRQQGIGGYLLLPRPFLAVDPLDIDHRELAARIKTRRFTETSSTKLEIQTVLWALEEVRKACAGNLQIHTDSQCVAGLLGRRNALTDTDFIAKRSGQPLANAAFYRAFYAAYDQLGFEIIKVRGHSPASSHDTVQRIFSYVDKEVRKALSVWMGEMS